MFHDRFSNFDRFWPWLGHGLLVAVFAIGLVLQQGYGFGAVDSANYIPFSARQLDPELYPVDDVFSWMVESSWGYHVSFFSTIMAMIGRLLSLEGAYFVGHLGSMWLLLFAWWGIGRAIGGAACGYLVLLAFLTSHQIGGTAIWTIATDFQPRTLAGALAFAAIALVVNTERRILFAAGLASLATLIHPISALMALPLVALAPWMADHPLRRRLRTGSATLAIVVVPYLAWKLLGPPGQAIALGSGGLVSQSWQAIMDAYLQGQAVNVSSWTPSEWLYIGLPLLFLLLALPERQPSSRADRMLVLAVLMAIGMAGVGSVGADVFRSAIASQLMLSRLLYLPMVVGTAYGAWWLWRRWQAGDWVTRVWTVLTFAAIALDGMAAALMGTVVLVALQHARHEVWLRLVASALGLGWLAVIVAVAWRLAAGPLDAAEPALLIFHQPSPARWLAVSTLAAAVLLASVLLKRRRAWALMGAAAMAPLMSPFLQFHLPPGHVASALASRVEWPWAAPVSDEAAVAAWAREATPKTSRFLVPLELRAFRARARRSVVMVMPDGGLVLFSETLAKRWQERFQTLHQFEWDRPEAIVALARAHRCAFVVLPREVRLELPVAFHHGRYRVYSLSAG